jgi:hypothetical protein
VRAVSQDGVPAKRDIEIKLRVAKYETRRIKTIQMSVETRKRVENIFFEVQAASIETFN